MRTAVHGCVVGAFLLLATLSAAPGDAAPMSSGQDSRDPALIPQFNFTEVAVRPGETGAIEVTVTNRFAQTLYSVQLEFAFQVGGEWRTARPVSSLAHPPQFENASVGPPPDMSAGERVTVRRTFTTAAGTPDGVYLVSLVVRFSYLDASNSSRGAVMKSFGAIGAEGDSGLVDMMNYSATIEALGIDGVAPDTSIVVDSHSGEALFWTAVGAGAIVVVAGFAYSESLRRRELAGRSGRRKRR